MVRSRLRELRTDWEAKNGRKLTYEVLQGSTGLAAATLARLFGFGPVDRIDGTTLGLLCAFFGCGVGDVLEYVPQAVMRRSIEVAVPGAAGREVEALGAARAALAEALASAGAPREMRCVFRALPEETAVRPGVARFEALFQFMGEPRQDTPAWIGAIDGEWAGGVRITVDPDEVTAAPVFPPIGG
jgi:DNA-binding Xre family transcriptional regulator